jgi:ubiquitin related modifier 1
MKVRVELGGGLDLLFGHVKEFAAVELCEDATPRALISALLANHLRERPELFISGDSVRPGILVLINEADWELLGMLDAPLKDGDCVTFISTLHGG